MLSANDILAFSMMVQQYSLFVILVCSCFSIRIVVLTRYLGYSYCKYYMWIYLVCINKFTYLLTYSLCFNALYALVLSKQTSFQ